MKFVEIKSIKKLENKEQVYDIETDIDHSFFGNNICIHNSLNPNLQNFPKRGDEGKLFRKVFIPPKDYLFCEADYSGFQLRIAGLYSDDPVMKDIFCNLSGDMHSVTAVGVFHRDITLEDFLKVKGKEPYKTSRFKSKGVNFSFIFGALAYSFRTTIRAEWSKKEIDEYIKSNKLSIKLDQHGSQDKYLTVAEDIRNKFFETYTNLLPWMKSFQDFAKENGYIESPFFKGARRHLPDLLKIGKDLSKEKQKHYNNLMNIAINSTVQCLHYDSVVYTDTESIKIGELYEKKLSQNGECIIYNGTDYKKAKVIHSGKFKTYRYIFSDGSSVISTNRHLYKVVKSDYTYEFKEAKNLTKTDFIQKCIPEILNKYQKFSVKSKYLTSSNEDKYFYNKEIIVNEDLAWILGIMIGDGTFNEKESGSCFQEYDYDNAVLFKDILCNVLDSDINIRTQKTYTQHNMYHVYTHLRIFNDILHGCGCYFKKSYDKRVPDIIWKSPKSVICSFLNGMFTTDGGVDVNSFNYTTVSKELAYELGNLLNMIGIRCSIIIYNNDINKYHTAYRIYINKDYLLFLELVGMTGNRRKNQIKKFINISEKRCNHPTDVPKWLSLDVVKNFKVSGDRSLNVIKSRELNHNKGLSRNTALRMFSDSAPYNFLKNNIFVTLKEVEEFEEVDTYDICMKEGNPEFITNTIAVHNTFEALIVYKALRKIWESIKNTNLKSRLIATVHDSIVMYIHKSEIEQMYHIIKNSMETYEYDIPIVIEQEYGRVWGFGEEVNDKNLKDFSQRALES